jgi:hypothetical protein
MARDEFFKRLPDAATAEATRALEAYCTQKAGLKAYSTRANTADLRVRIWPKGRVVLTAAYQPTKELFLCRAYCLPAAVIGMGISADRVCKPKQLKEPLRSEFRLTPDEYVEHLQAIAHAAATSFRNEMGVT